MPILEREDVLDLLRLFNLQALSERRRSDSEERQLQRLMAASDLTCACRGTATVRQGDLELRVGIVRVLATGFRVHSEHPLVDGGAAVLRLHEAGEPDYVFPCRVIAAAGELEAGLVLTELPSCEIPVDRWECPTRVASSRRAA